MGDLFEEEKIIRVANVLVKIHSKSSKIQKEKEIWVLCFGYTSFLRWLFVGPISYLASWMRLKTFIHKTSMTRGGTPITNIVPIPTHLLPY